ncbi:hypothetical protein BB559_000676 [Furculomyces boomerangus]|uniref:Uroporphyrinogen decarboxylase n=2 Tax=Harpellales TaxID=61421 RepID=A0A2T9Z4E7_9FUNG|nr:hypothetical protein BB559_000676 [Furculomyces boomerangus]PVZ99643.1 hypothetical protein BB558_004323 [Smittium angustum]
MSLIKFPELKNDLILRVLRGEKTERAPVWCMRQAGRYLPEFRAIRVENEFFKVCRNPELAAEVTIQPIRRYSGLLDASIIFCDILVIPQAMGMEVLMVPGKGPHFPAPLVVPEDMKKLVDREDNYSVHEELDYVYKAITLTRTRLDGEVPLFGFIGAPWTLMAYMIEGGGSKTFSKAKTWLWKYPEAAHELLDRITKVSVEFLKGQAAAGAQMLQVFDSWAGELAPADYFEFEMPYLLRIAEEVRKAYPDIPIVVFPKGVHPETVEYIVLNSEYAAVSLDWTLNPESLVKDLKARAEAIGKPIIFQGNLDPTVLFASKETIRTKTKEMCNKFTGCGHVCNLGHGMMPDHSPEHLGWFLEAVHEFSSKHQ